MNAFTIAATAMLAPLRAKSASISAKATTAGTSTPRPSACRTKSNDGIMAPAGTPKPIIERLNAAIVDALKDPQTAKLIEAQAMQIVGSSPQAFADFIKQDIVLWKGVAQEAKLEVK